MSDDISGALRRVQKYLDKRKEHEAFPNDTIVDLDEGSRGHTLLLESDLRSLVTHVTAPTPRASEEYVEDEG